MSDNKRVNTHFKGISSIIGFSNTHKVLGVIVAYVCRHARIYKYVQNEYRLTMPMVNQTVIKIINESIVIAHSPTFLYDG